MQCYPFPHNNIKDDPNFNNNPNPIPPYPFSLLSLTIVQHCSHTNAAGRTPIGHKMMKPLIAIAVVLTQEC